MFLNDPRVTQVFESYRERERADTARMIQLGKDGFARRDEFLLPIGEDAGRFLHAAILARKPRTIIELGTSYGYSTLLLADAARHAGSHVTTIDLAQYKQDFARDMLVRAGLEAHVTFICGDALDLLQDLPGPFDFVLLDIWKDLYIPCLQRFLPKLADEAMIAADNIIHPELARADMRAYRAAVAAIPEMTSALLPIGSGIELSVFWARGNQSL